MSYIPRHVVLSGEERPRLLAELTKRPALQRLYFLTLLLTGARRGEVRLMQRDHLDLATGTWLIPHPKNGRPHRLSLPSELNQAFRALPLRSPYVFSETGQTPWGTTTIERYWQQIRLKAGCRHLRIHDLRRTLATTLCRQGVPIQIVSWILNHQHIRTTEHYVQRGASPQVTAALADYARSMMGKEATA